MKIVIDCHIPFIQGVLEPYADVVYATPAEIDSNLVKDADAILVRTRTRIGADLLEAGKCRFVATATIGMDHIDDKWCNKNGVKFFNAPGCNAPAVAQYVFTAIGRLWRKPYNKTTLAIVGVGNVGSIVERWGQALGFNIMPVDPPRAEKEKDKTWYTLHDAAKYADIITFHPSLSFTDKHSAYHLADKAFFDALERKPMIINASRGPVIDNKEWLNAIKEGKIGPSVIDVWEGEPSISIELMKSAEIVTPHIAGYSLDGKIRATQMVLDALSTHFGLPELKAKARIPNPIPQTVSIQEIMESYNIADDDRMMREALNNLSSPSEIAQTFEKLRDFYSLRSEITPLPNKIVEDLP